jgi:hypothetical protein
MADDVELLRNSVGDRELSIPGDLIHPAPTFLFCLYLVTEQLVSFTNSSTSKE